MLRRKRAKQAVDDLHADQKRYIFAPDPFRKPKLKRGIRKKDQSDIPPFLATFVALITPRRFGKTEGFLRYAGSKCAVKPRTRVAVVYKHRIDGKDIAWPLLEELDEKYNWNCKTNLTALTFLFPNGSLIKIFGADHRFRGQQNDLVLIDEAQEFRDTLFLQRIMRKLVPGTADRHGRIFLVGTPGEVQSGLFWEIVDGQHPEYVLIEGKPFANPHTRKEFKFLLETYKKANPKIEEEAWVQREFFGKWVVDTRANVVTLIPEINYLYDWKQEPGDHFVISCDWGDDNAAFSVGTWNEKRYPYLILLETIVLKGELVSVHAETIKALQKKYPNATVVADPGGVSKAITRELTGVHGIGLIYAEKENRIGQIELLKTDVSLGLIKIFNIHDPEHPEDHPAAKQWRDLVWVTNERTGKREEGTPRDIHDTILYMRRWAAKHLFEPINDLGLPKVGSERYIQQQIDEMDRADLELAQKQGNRNKLW